MPMIWNLHYHNILPSWISQYWTEYKPGIARQQWHKSNTIWWTLLIIIYLGEKVARHFVCGNKHLTTSLLKSNSKWFTLWYLRADSGCHDSLHWNSTSMRLCKNFNVTLKFGGVSNSSPWTSRRWTYSNEFVIVFYKFKELFATFSPDLGHEHPILLITMVGKKN